MSLIEVYHIKFTVESDGNDPIFKVVGPVRISKQKKAFLQKHVWSEPASAI